MKLLYSLTNNRNNCFFCLSKWWHIITSTERPRLCFSSVGCYHIRATVCLLVTSQNVENNCVYVLLMVCYLPKFEFWQVCCLVMFLIAGICILASMLVGHYFRKFAFWQVCWLIVFFTFQNLHFGKYVGWSCLLLTKICILSVCLYGNFTKSQESVSQSSSYRVISKYWSMIPGNSFDKNVGQITRSRR